MLSVSRNGKINALLKRGDKWLPAVFFCCVLGLYLTMMISSYFVDELDVFYGGYNIVNSGDIYKVYPSQHMPFSYYMAAPGALLGARAVDRHLCAEPEALLPARAASSAAFVYRAAENV